MQPRHESNWPAEAAAVAGQTKVAGQPATYSHGEYFVRVICCLFLSTLLAFAQEEEIHVIPRSASEMRHAVASSLDSKSADIKVNVDLVLVPVTVTDSMERVVTGLERRDFELYEDKQPQDIAHFSSEDTPVSLAVVLDSSGSMENKLEQARAAAVEFLITANPQDEFMMVSFSDRPMLLAEFTQSIEDIQAQFISLQSGGSTALMDALYVALSRMRTARYERKAILVISDGGDNASRYNARELKDLVKESDVQIYAIGLFDPMPDTEEEMLGPALLQDLCDATGGTAFTVSNPEDLTDVSMKIGIALRHQYVLGYHPHKAVHDGKWRKIKVTLSPPHRSSALHLASKKGYYAPSR